MARRSGDEVDGSSAGELELAARAAYIRREFDESIELWERAHGAYRDSKDGLGAIRSARMLAYMNGTIIGNGAAMQGWQRRAQTLLTDSNDSVERGWIALNLGLFEENQEQRRASFHEAMDVARQHSDGNLEFGALAYLGATLVHGDEIDEGLRLLDEACAAVAGGEVDDFQILQEIFCQLFDACEYAHDINRAEEWSRIAEDVAARRELPSVAAFCRTHYGAILTAAGRWAEADAALTDAVRLWALGHRAIRWLALVRLADLRVRQGRLEEAEQLLDGLDAYTEAAKPLAALHLARGEVVRAADVLDRALEQMDPLGASAGPLWALSADAYLVRGDLERATEAVARLDEVAKRHPSDYVVALSALQRGRLCLASGTGDPRACLREAMSGFARAGTPMEQARARLELAGAMTAEPEVAIAEAKAALEGFERLQAARDVDAAAALLRRLGGPARTGPKGGGTLTKREGEVLELLGIGLSNPEISDRLFISRKTVEHHVTNVLAKLGLRSRAEAAAYAARTGTK